MKPGFLPNQYWSAENPRVIHELLVRDKKLVLGV
jgi:hypothetical protein